jgi:hypothetical protein
MQHTSERELIESIAQARVKYENIMNDQHTELRTDPQRLDAAVTKLNETPLIAELGQNWVPAEDMVDDYLAKCDGLCQIIPETFDEFSPLSFPGVYPLNNYFLPVESKSCMVHMQA